jgi:hypothetical protein
MGWIKRNLFFAIGGFVALALLGAAGFYDYASWNNNKKALADLTEVYNTLTELAKQKPSPGNSQTDNIAAAKDQEQQLRQWISKTAKYFQPIDPIPKVVNGQVSDPAFAGALHSNIVQLLREASDANVKLPPDFDFSFTAHMDRLTFAPGSLEALAAQLGEVKTISEILFGAGINALDGIERVHVSPDDANGPQTDYLTDLPLTNDLAVLVPYEVTFRGFSPEIARVLKGFAASPHGFIVGAISVGPAGPSGMSDTDAGGYPPVAGMPPGRMGFAPPVPAPMPGKGGLQTVLNEQLLRVTLTVELVNLTRKN